MNLENITAENIENGNLTPKQLIDLVNDGVNFDLVFTILSNIFLNYSMKMLSLDEKRDHIISLMQEIHSMKGKYKPKKSPKKSVKEPKKIINVDDVESIQISI